jgi:hypothetical protein
MFVGFGTVIDDVPSSPAVNSSFHEIVDRFILFCKVWSESIWYTLQELDDPYFSFQMEDEVFNLSLHTMTICLHSKSDLVHLTSRLEFLLVDELLNIIESDCFELVVPKSNCVEDVWENVPTFLARYYTSQIYISVHDDEGNGFF